MNACIKCGSVDRYENGKCKPCHRAAVSKWKAANMEKAKANRAKYYADNREKEIKHRADWYAANPQRALAVQAKYYAENKDKAQARSREWKFFNQGRTQEYKAQYRVDNKESVLLNNQNYRARKRAATGVLSKGLSDKLLKLQRGKCACCGQPLGADYHLDHRMPLALEGPNADENIQLLCAKCNLSKGAKHPIDFMQQRGFLL